MMKTHLPYKSLNAQQKTFDFALAADVIDNWIYWNHKGSVVSQNVYKMLSVLFGTLID